MKRPLGTLVWNISRKVAIRAQVMANISNALTENIVGRARGMLYAANTMSLYVSSEVEQLFAFKSRSIAGVIQ
jgi:hypothetical protein